MVRSLYRFYLYLVVIGLLLFAAFGAGSLLRIVLEGTSLRGTYAIPPTHADIVQAILIFTISWLFGLLLGGLHYWLIRQDLRTDPGAGRGAVRAFFLNWIESWAATVLAGSGAYTLSNLGGPYPPNVTYSLATAIVTAGLVAALEMERRRATAGPGAARVFQRLNFYGTQFIILLGVGTFTWLNTLSTTVRNWLIASGRISAGYCGDFACGPRQDVGPWAAALFVAGIWVFYALLAYGDSGSLMRQLLHLAGVVVGLGFLLSGLSQAAELGVRWVTGQPVNWEMLLDQYQFIPPLVFGAVVIAGYSVLLLREAEKLPSGRATGLAIAAVAAAVTGWWFWEGCDFVLRDVVAQLTQPTHPGSEVWAQSLGTLAAGTTYVVILPLLYLRARRTGILGPLRGYTFVALGAGVLTAVISGAISLYALGTQMLGAPLPDWEMLARNSGETAAVGVAIVALHVAIALQQHFFRLPSVPTAGTLPPESVASVPPSAPDASATQ
jgi:hypothetical protein